jgi:outer membrane receptor protein involved in Fe transport
MLELTVKKIYTFCLMFVFLGISPAHSNSDSSQPNLSEQLEFFKEEAKVYSASRKEQTIRDAPQVVTVITQQELKLLGARTINDVLALVPGFDVQKQIRKDFLWTRGNLGSAQVLIDGTSIMNPGDNEAILDEAFQIENIKRVEILRGPGGVLWGTNAFLGVVNIITIDPLEEEPFTEVTVGGGSLDPSATGLASSQYASLAVSQKIGDFGIFVSGKYLDEPKQEFEIEDTPGEPKNPSSFYGDYYAKIRYKSWTLSHRYDKHRDFSFMHDVTAVHFKDPTIFYEEDPTSLTELKYSKQFSESFKLNAKTWWLQRRVTIWAPLAQDQSAYVYFDENIQDRYGAEVELKQNIGTKDSIVYGASYEHVLSYNQNIEQLGTSTPCMSSPCFTNYGMGHVRNSTTSLFAQETHSFSEYWTVGAGLRFISHNMKMKVEKDGDFKSFSLEPQWVMNLNTVYHFGANTTKLVIAKGYRQPDIEQMSSAVGNFSGNTDVSEEQVYSYEIDHMWKVSEKLSWRNNYSYNDIYGLIDFYDSGGGVFAARNLPHAIIHAAESELRYHRHGGSFGFVNFSFQDGKTQEGDEFSIEGTNKLKIAMAYSHALTRKLYWSNIIHHVGSKRDQHQTDDGNGPEASPKIKDVPAYTIVNTGLTWMTPSGLNASLFINNLFDTKYHHQNRMTKKGYLHEQPGINFFAKVGYRF